MKKFFMSIACVCMTFLCVFAGDEEVTVKVSIEGNNDAELRQKCEVAGKKAAIKKYLLKQNKNMPEKVVDEAMSSYAKFIEGIDADDSEYEDGELTCSYTVTIKREDLAQWLQQNGGVSSDEMADGTKLEIFVMEEPPDAGQMQLGDDVGKFFFKRYNMFQRRVRDALVKQVNEVGFDVILLEDNENYTDMKKKDPVLVGVSYDVNADTRGFTKTENFVQTVQENNPDAIALYYRIDTLAYDADTKKIRVSVSLSFKSLSSNKTQSIGSRDFEITTRNTKEDMLMADFGLVVERATKSLLNGEGAAAKLQGLVKSLTVERPKGPLKLVVNCKMVDKKIKIKFRLAIKKALIEKGITEQSKIKIVKDTLSCTVTKKDIPDLDELWGAVSEIITEAGVEDITDEAAKKNGDTLTVTPGMGGDSKE